MMRRYFITASGTGVGKTLVTTALCGQLGATATAMKPVATGWKADDRNTDTRRILQSLGRPATPETMDAISPFRFAAPLSPDMAAEREGRELDFQALLDFCKFRAGYDYLLIEGVGGVMTPLTRDKTVLDWMTALGDPAILVVGSYLGALSHALTAHEALRQRKLRVASVIVSESGQGDAPFADTCMTLRRFVGAPVISLPRLSENDYEKWKYAPDLLAAIN